MENLKFISTIDTIELLRISFIVQRDNYSEMAECARIMIDIFKERISKTSLKEHTTLFFGRIAKWTHMTDKDLEEKDVANPNHPKHKEFIKSLKEVYTYENQIYIQSNLTDGLNESDEIEEPVKTLI